MPFDVAAPINRRSGAVSEGRRSRVAIIGTGISGLSAAWALQNTCDITVFEKAGRIGGHTATVTVEAPEGPVPVDTGFIVFNEPNYPNLTALFDRLGVASNPTRMNFSVSMPDERMEYASHGMDGLFAWRRNMASPRFFLMLKDILRFHAASHDLAQCQRGRSIGDYIAEEKYGRAFVDYHLLPMAAAIWSCPVSMIMDFPAASLARFFVNHGLVRVRPQFPWQSVDGGSASYLAPMTQGFSDRIRCNAGIESVHRTAQGVRLRFSDGTFEDFDEVVFACHAPEALALLADAAEPETRILSGFRTQPNRVILHRDETLMPIRKAAWAAWNYRARQADSLQLSVTYWMNALQRLETTTNYFVTLNPEQEPTPDKVEQEFVYNHPVFDGRAMQAQREIWSIQGHRNTWFCGAWQGYGFHEDGIQSGLAVAELLSDWKRPWAFDYSKERLARPEAGKVSA
ncbi:FAD-dependent oxidoreductase [Hyphomonas sp.]|uniref:NAD(P)/FAD-dependent oxidoreductase n=1 Tax=Hyphomonas sp. TaxID=87 RepID=UPI000C35AAF2|nr:FAD-dependent oxidoreductase [Hyphomonas sp.]MAB11416.1 NAD/FAD-binding protein [Hyphomonas sp.]MAU67086.1 NAD/FAD-binding protein [Hyphomonas sp.]